MTKTVDATIPGKNAQSGIVTFVPTAMVGYDELMGFHRHLLEDGVRTNTFCDAIAQVVKPGDVVADLGSGTGILSLAACKAGAARVYAIELGKMSNVTAVMAADHGYDDRVQVIAGDSHDITLPEKVDVVISECIGLMGTGGTMIDSVVDLADRHFKPGQTILPRGIDAYLAPVSAPEQYDYVQAWSNGSFAGFDLSRLQELASCNVYHALFDQKQLLAAPQQVTSVRLAQGSDGVHYQRRLTFRFERDVELHGYAGWFDVELLDGVRLASSPMDTNTVWQQLFFPLLEPVKVSAGEELRVGFGLREDLADSPVYYWNTMLVDSKGVRRALQQQSTLRSWPS